MSVRKRKLLFISTFLLIVFAVLLSGIVYYKSTHFYYHVDNKVYVSQIAENTITVTGLPEGSGQLQDSYIIRIKEPLTLKNMEGGEIDFFSLQIGDILLFDYKGTKEPAPKAGAVLNSGRYGIYELYNLRLSDEKLNGRFWGIDLEKE